MLQVILILILFLPMQQEYHALHIVFVEPAGEEFTQDEMNRSLDNIRGAISFWSKEIDIRITDTQFITVEYDVIDYFPSLQYDPNVTMQQGTMFIIDNSASQRYFSSSYDGWADMYALWVLTSTSAGTYAHEFGHHYFALNHQYQEPVDIMNLVPDVAYQRHFIGCPSLEALGKPCHKIFLPKV